MIWCGAKGGGHYDFSINHPIRMQYSPESPEVTEIYNALSACDPEDLKQLNKLFEVIGLRACEHQVLCEKKIASTDPKNRESEHKLLTLILALHAQLSHMILNFTTCDQIFDFFCDQLGLTMHVSLKAEKFELIPSEPSKAPIAYIVRSLQQRVSQLIPQSPQGMR